MGESRIPIRDSEHERDSPESVELLQAGSSSADNERTSVSPSDSGDSRDDSSGNSDNGQEGTGLDGYTLTSEMAFDNVEQLRHYREQLQTLEEEQTRAGTLPVLEFDPFSGGDDGNGGYVELLNQAPEAEVLSLPDQSLLTEQRDEPIETDLVIRPEQTFKSEQSDQAELPEQLLQPAQPGEGNQYERPVQAADDRQVENAETRLESLPTLEGDDLFRSRYLQENLKVLTPRLWTGIGPDGRPMDAEKSKEALDLLLKQLEEEHTAGKFGPATIEAYGKFIDWFERDAVRGALGTLDNLGIPVPPGCPIELPVDQDGFLIRPGLHTNMALLDQLKFSSGLVRDRIPGDDQLDAMEQGLDWLETSRKATDRVLTERQKEILTDIIKKDGLPEGWLIKDGEDTRAWVLAASEMVDLASRTRNYVEAMHSMAKESANGDFPFKLPPGSSITIKIGDKEHVIPAGRELEHRSIINNRNGVLTTVNLDLPKNLKQDLGTEERAETIRQWLDSDTCQTIEKALFEYVKAAERPESVIMFGDQEISSGPGQDIRGRFNSRGEMISLVDAGKYSPGDGETLRRLNLLSYDFDVKRTDDGKILVEQEIQAWDMPIWAYQNIRAFGEKVGNPLSFSRPVPEDFAEKYEAFDIKVNGETRTLYRNKSNDQDIVSLERNGDQQLLKEVKLYNPDQFIPVSNGSHMEVMQAKHLESYLSNQKLFYYGEKGLMMALDGAMLVSGSIGVAGAVRAARLTSAGMRLTGGQLAWQLGKEGTRVAVAGAGVFNNAGAREHAWGQNLNTARGIYFLADISQGLLRGGIGALRSGGRVTETLSGSQKVHNVIYGTKAAEGARAIEGAEVLKGMGWVKQVHQGSNITFKVTEYGFAPIIGKELLHQFKEIKELGARNGLEDALVQIGDGRGLQTAGRGAFNPGDQRALEGTRQLLDSYSDVLSDGRRQEISRRVQEIFSRTGELMGPDATAEDRAAYRAELVAGISFTPEQIQALEQTRRATLDADNGRPSDSDFYGQLRLSAEDLTRLLDPATRKDVRPRELAQMAEGFLAQQDRDLRAASIIALAYLSRDADGNVPESLGKGTVEVPSYKTRVYESRDGGSEVGTITSSRSITVESRQAEVSLSTEHAMKMLRDDIISGDRSSNRGIAIGDFLVRTGGMSHRHYGAVLQDVLNRKESSPQDKMRALADAAGPRFASIIDGVRYEEHAASTEGDALSRQRAEASMFGLSSEDLKQTLVRVAGDAEESEDVRAMAAVLLYGLAETNVKSRNELMRAATERWLGGDRQLDGSFATEARALLRRDMAASIEGDAEESNRIRERRLDAAQSLALITPKDDVAMQREINDSLASSFSTTNGALAIRALDLLLPDRIKELERDHASLAGRLRESAVSMIKLPRSLDEQDVMVALLERMDKLFVLDKGTAISDPVKLEQARNLVNTSMAFLNPNSVDADDRSAYARWYPELRKAAIETLADFGSQASKEVIRLHLSASETLKIGDREVTGVEPVAAVRLAAIKALGKLGDPDFERAAYRLLLNETDHRVASELRDINFSARPIEPDTPEWSEIRAKWAERLSLGELVKSRIGDNFDYRAYLNSNYPLLNLTTFGDDALGASNNANSWYNLFYRETNRREAVDKIVSERDKQWGSLVDLARQDGNEGLKAKVALFRIIDDKANLLGIPQNLNLAGEFYKYNPDYIKKASEVFKELAREGKDQTDFTKWAVRNLLEGGNAADNPGAQKDLLDAWSQLHARGAVTVEEYAVTLGNALKLQSERSATLGYPKATEAEQIEIQLRLIDELARFKTKDFGPILDALSHGVSTLVGEAGSSKYPKVKARATGLLEDMQDSVEAFWNVASTDVEATPAERADALKRVLDGETLKDESGRELRHSDAERVIKTMFASYRGYTFEGENDPGLAELYRCLKGDNERVRLAAAKVIIEGGANLGAGSMIKETTFNTLLEMSRNGTKSRYRSDAGSYLLDGKRKELGPTATVPSSVSGLLNDSAWIRSATAAAGARPLHNGTSHLSSTLESDRGNFNYESTVKAIFEAAQGDPITSELDTRRLHLMKALEHDSDRVRLASAWVLSESYLDQDRDAGTRALAHLATNSSGAHSRTEARALLSAMLHTGNETERARTHAIWLEVAKSSNADVVEAPPLIPTESERAISYFLHAPNSELKYLVENGSVHEKREVLKAMYEFTDTELNEWLKPPPPSPPPLSSSELRRPIQFQSTIHCHQPSSQRSDFNLSLRGFNDLDGNSNATRDRLAQESAAREQKMDDFLLSLSRGASAGPARHLIWKPSGEAISRPELRGKVTSTRFGQQSFSDEDMELLRLILQERKSK